MKTEIKKIEPPKPKIYVGDTFKYNDLKDEVFIRISDESGKKVIPNPWESAEMYCMSLLNGRIYYIPTASRIVKVIPDSVDNCGNVVFVETN